MKAVTIKEFQDDFCKTCVYKEICTEDMKRDCYTFDDMKIIHMLAKMIYGEETSVI